MSPIYVRPEREQAEHDRLIRYLQDTYSRKYEALANPGDDRVAPVKLAGSIHFPDLVLADDKRLAGVVEIETAASVNNLEAMAKWVPFSRARVPFHLYVPVQGYETALRLADAFQVKAAEIWTYRSAVEGFDLVRMFADPALQNLKPLKTGLISRPAPPPVADAAKAEPDQPSVGAKKTTGAAKAGKPAKIVKQAPPTKSAASSKKAVKKAVKKAIKKATKKAAKKSVKTAPRKAASRTKAPTKKAVARKVAKPARKATKSKPARKAPKAKKKSVRKHR